MNPDDDSALRALLQSVGRRPAPPEEVSDAVYRRTRRAWRIQLRRRQLTRRGYLLAVGLVLALVVGRITWELYPHQVVAAAPAGQAVEISHSIWHPFASRLGGALYAGDSVQTRLMGVRLRPPEGGELRLAHDTRLEFGGSDSLLLRHGRLYVETDDAAPGARLVVLTDLGRIEHLGTRYMVQSEPGALVVAVRDGRVALHYARDQAVELQGGQAAHLDSQGALLRFALEPFDGSWNWVDALSKPLAIDGQSLYAVLAEIAQRTGTTLRFQTPALEAAARGFSLHGPALDLPPRPALDAVLATTTFTGAVEGREIVIGAR